MTTYSRPGHPQVHGTADPDTQPPERFADRIDPAALAEFNAGVRRARAAAGWSREGHCIGCMSAASGRCRDHQGET